jgi:hypothetical protein
MVYALGRFQTSETTTAVSELVVITQHASDHDRNPALLLDVVEWLRVPVPISCSACHSRAYVSLCRSQWLRGLRHEPSSLTGTLGSWVRIPLKAWMCCVRLFCVCVVLCVGSGLVMG